MVGCFFTGHIIILGSKLNSRHKAKRCRDMLRLSDYNVIKDKYV